MPASNTIIIDITEEIIDDEIERDTETEESWLVSDSGCDYDDSCEPSRDEAMAEAQERARYYNDAGFPVQITVDGIEVEFHAAPEVK